MMKHILIALVAAVLLTACGTSRQATGNADASATHHNDETAAMAYKKRVVSNMQTRNNVTARIKMELRSGGKDISANGSLKMKRDDVIQLSLSFLGFEVGRMEFTPAEVLIIDRVNKQYVRARYDQVSFLKKAELDFYALQALFWNELFVPGQREAQGQLQRFTVTESGDHTLLHLTDTRQLDYSFLTITKSALLNRVTVQSKNPGEEGQLTWRYSNFTNVGGKQFPQQMEASFAGLGREAGFTLSLSRLSNDDKWETRTTVSSKYKERDANALLRQLFGN